MNLFTSLAPSRWHTRTDKMNQRRKKWNKYGTLKLQCVLSTLLSVLNKWNVCSPTKERDRTEILLLILYLCCPSTSLACLRSPLAFQCVCLHHFNGAFLMELSHKLFALFEHFAIIFSALFITILRSLNPDIKSHSSKNKKKIEKNYEMKIKCIKMSMNGNCVLLGRSALHSLLRRQNYYNSFSLFLLLSLTAARAEGKEIMKL